MQISKNDLKDIKSIELALENCEYFKIYEEDILDINFPKIVMGEDKSDNEADEGYILISKNACNTVSSMLEDLDNSKDVPKENYYLCNRVKNSCDLCQIYIDYKNGNELLFFVPYEPLESFSSFVVEYTNCSSAEITDEGNLLICCGKSSKVNTRIDDNYNDLIGWLDDRIKQKIKDELQIKIDRFETSNEIFKNIEMDCRVINKQLAKMELNLEFYDVSDLNLALDFDRENNHSLRMSRLTSGLIFVSISNMIEFKCKVVVDYNSCPYLEYETCEDDKYYLLGLKTELNEQEMITLAYNHFASDVSIKSEYIINAFDKVLSGKISFKYFKVWLKFVTDLMHTYISVSFASYENMQLIKTKLMALYLDLFYYNDINDCSSIIKNTYMKIEEFLK